MGEVGRLLEPQKWKKIKEALVEKNGKIKTYTIAGIARQAGISTIELRSWIKRSREQRAEDEPWVHEIAQILEDHKENIHDALKEKLFDQAINGVTTPIIVKGQVVGECRQYDPRLALSLLEKLDKDFQGRDKEMVQINVGVGEGDQGKKTVGGLNTEQVLAKVNMAKVLREASQSTRDGARIVEINDGSHTII